MTVCCAQARVLSPAHYASPQAFVDDTLTTLASMPGDTGAARRLFVELSDAWLHSSGAAQLHEGTTAAAAVAQDRAAGTPRSARIVVACV